jgi:hypothetical protein
MEMLVPSMEGVEMQVALEMAKVTMTIRMGMMSKARGMISLNRWKGLAGDWI